MNHQNLPADHHSLKAELLSYISDDINRLSNALILGRKVKNKIQALQNYQAMLNKTESILDLIILANQMLVDPHIIEKRILFSSGLTDVEKNICRFLLTINNYEKIQMGDSAKIVGADIFDIQSFTDQMQITSALTGYIRQYKNFHIVLPAFNERSMVIAEDHVPVMFDLEGVLASSDANIRMENGAIGKAILNNIISAFEYLLAQNINPSLFSVDKLRLCIGINHSQAHWTALVVDVEKFFSLYQKMHAAKSNYYFESIDNLSEQVLANHQRDIIFNVLGLHNVDPDASQLLKIFSGQLQLTIRHFDSMNSKLYYNEICDSTKTLVETLGAVQNSYGCSQQKGNTCGDHTACNLIGIGLYNVIPVINQEPLSNVTSHTLRTFTNNHSDSDLCNQILDEAIFKQRKNMPEIPVHPEVNLSQPIDNTAAGQLMHIINLYIERLYFLAPEKTTELLHAIQIARGNSVAEIELSVKNHLQSFAPVKITLYGTTEASFYNEIEDRMMILNAVFHNICNPSRQILFKELGIADVDSIQYCALSRLFIREKQNDIETRKLSNEFKVDEQLIGMNLYKK